MLAPTSVPVRRVAPGFTYARRRPDLTTLHKVVRENIATLYAAAEAGFDGTPLPPFVRQELDGYVGCGSLNRGFAHLRCEAGHSRLVAFSCHGRGFCPSCMGRRMAQASANLLENVATQCTSWSCSACRLR